MAWYEIIGVLGGLGGLSAFLISLYNAKSNKQTIDIGNMKSMLDEAHKMYDEMKDEKDAINKDFHEYKEENMKYVAEFKERFKNLEARLDKTEDEVLNLKKSIYQGYRCKYPQNIDDCPVIKAYERFRCNECEKKSEDCNIKE